MPIPDDLLTPYGPIWVIDQDRELYEWDERFGDRPDDIVEYIEECLADEWQLVA